MGTVNWHGLYALVHHHSSEGYVPNGGAKTKGDHPHEGRSVEAVKDDHVVQVQ
jgi:hypothetical protein